MGSFEIIGHTSEVGFEATGSDLEEAFEEAGKALFSLMADLERIQADESVSFSLESEDRKSLLFDFLDELIYRRDVERLLFSDFDVSIRERDDAIHLDATATGSSSATIPAQDVKAVTYSDMEIQDHDSGTSMRVIVDV